MSKRRIVLLALILSIGFWAGGASAWDDTGVRVVIEKAIDALPKPIKKFYEEREEIILAHVMDPIRTGQRLTFELDRFGAFPFDDIPEDRQAAVSKFGEETLEEAGDLPWKLQDTFEKLIEAYRNMDIEAIETLSAEIAFLVGELQNPVNVSKYGDGEPIDQDGLRERFDERLLEVYGEKIKFDTPSAIYLDRPSEYAFNIARRAYIWVDNILLHDYIARQGVMSYDRFYYEGLWLRSSLIINQMLQNLSRDAASYWYTAWIEAGKPELPKK